METVDVMERRYKKVPSLGKQKDEAKSKQKDKKQDSIERKRLDVLWYGIKAQ